MPFDSRDDEISQRFLAQVRWVWIRYYRLLIAVLAIAVLAAMAGYAIDNRRLSSAEMLELEQEIEENLRQNLFNYPTVKFEVKVEDCSIRLKQDIRNWCSNSSLVAKSDQLIVMNEVEKLRTSQLDGGDVLDFRFSSDIVAHREFAESFHFKHRKELISRTIERNVPAATIFVMDTGSKAAKAYLEQHNIYSYKYSFQCHGGYGLNSLPYSLSFWLKNSTASSLLKSIETYRKQCHQLD